MSWYSLDITLTKLDYDTKKFAPRLCDKEDVGELLFNSGGLFICPPKEGLKMEN